MVQNFPNYLIFDYLLGMILDACRRSGFNLRMKLDFFFESREIYNPIIAYLDVRAF